MPIVILQTMNYDCVTKKILKVANNSTVWTSTIKFPFMTMSLVLTLAQKLGENCQSPLMEQPSSLYMFDPDLYGENSLERLKAMLAKVGCVSGCSLVIRNSNNKKTVYWKAT